MSIHIVLHEPEIPQNTGNIARTCAAIGAELHLIKPLGFSLESKYVRRAGLDYWPLLKLSVHESLEAWLETRDPGMAVYPVSTKAAQPYWAMDFPENVCLVFGKESAGLPVSFLEAHPHTCIRIPMREEARSLNLSNAVAITAYEVLRQNGFPDLQSVGILGR